MTGRPISPTPDVRMEQESRTYSKIVGTAGIFVSGWAAWGMGSTAAGILLGYATAGAAVPLVAYTGVFALAASRVKVHGKKLGWDIVLKDDGAEVAETHREPSIPELEKEVAVLEGDIEALKSRVREVREKIHLAGHRNPYKAPSDPKM